MSLRLIKEVGGIYNQSLLLKAVHIALKPEFDLLEVTFQDKEIVADEGVASSATFLASFEG
ncbi:hypothetical protein CASFOL_029448 [Castilleja foliolosa]|uniref:Uncharacterized protein n=1 Tax=Castilleja foliolosa TaxID=1961234 RepID=A0ABD3CA46_9LAMI